MTRCPICNIPWPAPVACCPCGFAPAALDEFVVRLRIARRSGVKRQLLGLALAASVVPFVWLLALSGAWVLATPLVGGLLVGGSIQFLRGTAAVHQATRRLRATRQLRMLPVARIIEHKS